MKPFKVVVAGCGSMANTWVEYALSREDTEIVGLVDISEENARKMADKFGLTYSIFKDIKEAIVSTEANLVFDVTIPEVHRKITGDALLSGCNVFGEKPMAASMEQAKELVEIARQSGKMYAVMQNRRYMKQIRAFRKLLSGGTIGDIGFIKADFFLGPHFGGFRDAMESPLILDMAIHTFDQARFIASADPVSVYCHEFNPSGSWYKGDAAAVCIFEFSNGAVFSYNGSWCAEGVPTSWESSWRITGSLGTAIWDGHQALYCEVLDDPDQQGKFFRDYKKIEAELNWDGKEGHKGCLDEMFNALIEGRDAETVCTDNIKSMAMVFGALESARTGEKVKLSY
jgi:predicted dehydrogenase